MKQPSTASRALPAVRKLVLAAVLATGVVAMMLWLAGVFHGKVPAEAAQGRAGTPVGDTHLAPARILWMPVMESAVGTIRPVYEAAVASKLMERVTEVNVKSGQTVRSGEVLVRLDDSVLKTQLARAQEAQNNTQAARNQAQREFDGTTQAFNRGAASKIELDRAETALKSAEAEFSRAQQAVQEARSNLDFTVIRSPMDGTIVEKKVNVGDMAAPGTVLLTLFDPTRMQLVASVRESLRQRLKQGQDINVRIGDIDKTCTGTVSEIVPEAESASRTFSVKVTGPCQPGVLAGMFGRLLIPLDEERLLVIPASAVRHIGQLDVVEVAEDGVLHRRAVQLGRTLIDPASASPGQPLVEVLSGLREGERVAVPRQAATTSAPVQAEAPEARTNG